jgi:hypothetical protein
MCDMHKSCYNCGVVLDISILQFKEKIVEEDSKDFNGYYEKHIITCPVCKEDVLIKEVEIHLPWPKGDAILGGEKC